jgi:hypothetical protein
MSINYCTLGSNTVDSFCSPRRGIVFNKLVRELHPPIIVPQPTGGNPQSIRNTAAIAQLLARQQRPRFDVDDRDPMVYEQPFISVTVELFGATGTQTMDVSGVNVDIVTVTNLEFGSAESEIVVNIFDFEIE